MQTENEPFETEGPIALPTTLPNLDSGSGLTAYRSVREALAAYTDDAPFYVLYPKRIMEAATAFISAFSGRTLYAVKANPHPAILKLLWAAGIRDYDVASTAEIETVRTILPDAGLYLMNPVKSRATIRNATAVGVNDFSFDCADELEKICEETNGALHLHLRIAVRKNAARMPLVGKFGAGFDDAVALLKAARPRAAKLGVAFHVGSQCLDPSSYRDAIDHVGEVVAAAGVPIDSIDIGGGFPANYPDMSPPPLVEYMAAIDEGIIANGLEASELIGEPGRALVAHGGSTLARVDLRKGQDLYLNEGGYGSLFDAAVCDWQFPVRLWRDGADPTEETAEYRLFGPTCDSLDVMTRPVPLPADISEGDWLEIEHLGAYGQTLATGFNGFGAKTTFALLEDE